MRARWNNLWRRSKIGRVDFLVAMFLSRLAFDIGGNATYGSLWCLAVFSVYATLELFLVRARVRDFDGNVRRWTEFYSVGLAIGALLVLGTIQQMYAHPLEHFSYMNRLLDRMFNWLMLYPNVYLCIAKSIDGEYVRHPDLASGLTPERVPVRVRVSRLFRHRDS